ncbi:MAG: DinB family protein [bacterium]|nr:DinB family protein [bacterium]
MTIERIQPPQSDEYGSYYAAYVGRVPPDSDIFALLRQQPADLRDLLASVSEDQTMVRPAPGEWSIREVLGHLCDTERIFAYRALCVARGDSTPLPGFEQDDYVRATDFNARSLADLLDEFELQRRANIVCFMPLTEIELLRRGTASENPITARSLLFMMAGHVLHHIESFRMDYHISD